MKKFISFVMLYTISRVLYIYVESTYVLVLSAVIAFGIGWNLRDAFKDAVEWWKEESIGHVFNMDHKYFRPVSWTLILILTAIVWWSALKVMGAL